MNDSENKNTPEENDESGEAGVQEQEQVESPAELESPDEVVIPEMEHQIQEEDDAEPPQEESKSRRRLRKVLRWTAGILILIGLGFLTAVFSLYLPIRADLNQARQDRNQAEQQIEALNNQISTLESETASQATTIGNLRTENEDLLSKQQAYELRIAVLKARVDVANATLAIEQDNTATARLVLNGTLETLQRIEDELPADQSAALDPLQQRLELVLSELESDVFAALSDLNVLEAQLLQLEDDLFDR